MFGEYLPRPRSERTLSMEPGKIKPPARITSAKN
jgi:hypothetical protein